MTRVFSYLTVLVLSLPALGQSQEEGVKQTINQLFTGMRQGNGNLVREAFADGAILQTIMRTKDGHVVVRSEEVDSFAAIVARPHTEVYDERIEFETLRIDGDLAVAWTPYRFYVGEKFSHCGVNSFQLVKLKGVWKIQYLIDTRRKGACL